MTKTYFELRDGYRERKRDERSRSNIRDRIKMDVSRNKDPNGFYATFPQKRDSIRGSNLNRISDRVNAVKAEAKFLRSEIF